MAAYRTFPDARMGLKGRMTQEVAMQGALKKISAGLDQILSTKKRIQQERLVNRDFPWLYSVRNLWFFPMRDATAGYPDQQLSDLLRSNFGGVEIWIRREDKRHLGRHDDYSYFAVEKVELRSSHFCWADAVCDTACYDGITHVVVVTPGRSRHNGSEDESGREVKVYRPRKPAVVLDMFIGDIFFDEEQTRNN